MTTDTIRRSDLAALARDPLVRLVMASDGVTEAQFVAVLRDAQRAVAAHRRGLRSPRRRGCNLRVVPARTRRGVWM
jgi:hypothetical protein